MVGAHYDNPGRPFSRHPSNAQNIFTVRGSKKNVITPTRRRA
jgi:hypothetical protein